MKFSLSYEDVKEFCEDGEWHYIKVEYTPPLELLFVDNQLVGAFKRIEV